MERRAARFKGLMPEDRAAHYLTSLVGVFHNVATRIQTYKKPEDISDVSFYIVANDQPGSRADLLNARMAQQGLLNYCHSGRQLRFVELKRTEAGTAISRLIIDREPMDTLAGLQQSGPRIELSMLPDGPMLNGLPIRAACEIDDATRGNAPGALDIIEVAARQMIGATYIR